MIYHFDWSNYFLMIGLAFREDALEELVGPLGDEFDEPE